MKTVQEVIYLLDHDVTKTVEEILREWSEEIIDECASKLSDEGAIQEGWLWQRILKTKELI